MESAKNAKNSSHCHDCKKELNEGVTLVYDDNGDKITIYKCRQCFKKNPALTDFRKCEVYSRIVGYLRPISQWNVGKKQEYFDRNEYAGRN